MKMIKGLLAVLIVIIGISCNRKDKNEPYVNKINDEDLVIEKTIDLTDKDMLEGDWIRTDGEYRIEISKLDDNGKMKAGYFNPNPIHVSQAQWINEGGFLKLYIEMRDQNYPGSNYNLVYLKDRNILAGEYYHAIERNKYKVEFTKAK